MARFVSSTLLAVSLLAPLAAPAQLSISIGIAPPPLPIYRQPPPPGNGYLWTPGYWAWNESVAGYYWVPGTWVLAPRPGYLWTPGYWSYIGTGYRWNPGYWGPRVGFYGGIAYGFGYPGRGYVGGRWDRGTFQYNTAVNNVNTTVVRNVYRTEVVNNNYDAPRTSFNGGAGVKAEPTREERQARQAQVVDPTPSQVEHERRALKEPAQRLTERDVAPRVVATTKPAALDAPDAVRGSGRSMSTGKPSGEQAEGKDAEKIDRHRAKGGSTGPAVEGGRDGNASPKQQLSGGRKEGDAGESGTRERSAKDRRGATDSASDLDRAAAARPGQPGAKRREGSDERTYEGRSATAGAKDRSAERAAQVRGGGRADHAPSSGPGDRPGKEEVRQ